MPSNNSGPTISLCSWRGCCIDNQYLTNFWVCEVADGDHHIFMSGNDAEAKSQVADLLKSFGWMHILDLGDITTARGAEMYLPLWADIRRADQRNVQHKNR